MSDERPKTFSDVAGDALDGLGRSLSERAAELERANAESDEERQRLEKELKAAQEDRPMLPVAEWIKREYYVGALANPPGQGGLFPRLVQVLIDIFEGDDDSNGEPYFEIILGGAQGWGKSTLAKAIGMRCLYELSCFATPQFSVGRSMTRQAQILFLNYNVSEAVARATIFEELKADLREVEYFTKEFPLRPGLEATMSFPKRILWRPGIADARGAVSENLLVVILDECNEYEYVEESLRAQDGGVFDAAESLFQRSYDRISNRFMLPGAKFPRTAKIICISQAQYPKDFIERRKAAARKADHPVKICSFAEWETHPRSQYQLGWFYCAIAPKGKKHELLEEHDVGTPEAEAWRAQKEAEGFAVREVPREYQERFRNHIERAIRTYIGVATETVRPFLRRRETIQMAVDERRRTIEASNYAGELETHPYSVEVTTLKDGGTYVREAFCYYDEKRRLWLPVVNPRAQRFAHFDLSKNKDKTGFVVGHVWDRREVKRMEKVKGATEFVSDIQAVIWVDFALQIKAPRGDKDGPGVIDLADARSLVRELSELGFRFRHISYDQAYSEDTIQRLRDEHYDVGLQSVDRTMGPYNALRRSLYQRRLMFYGYAPLHDELIRLEENMERGKIDHPPGHSKDVSDALAAVVWHCETIGMEGAAGDEEAMADAMAPSMQQPAPFRRGGERSERKRARTKGSLPREVLDIYLGSGKVAPPKKQERKPRPSPTIWTRTYGRDRENES